jgi:hypothetical protein
MPCFDPTGEIDYVAVAKALQSFSPDKRTNARRALEFMADKRKTRAAYIVAGLVFTFAFLLAAAMGQNPFIMTAIAVSSGLVTLIVVLIFLKLM